MNPLPLHTHQVNPPMVDTTGAYNFRHEIRNMAKRDPSDADVIDMLDYLERREREVYASITKADIADINLVFEHIKAKGVLPEIEPHLAKKIEIVSNAVDENKDLPNVEASLLIEISEEVDSTGNVVTAGQECMIAKLEVIQLAYEDHQKKKSEQLISEIQKTYSALVTGEFPELLCGSLKEKISNILPLVLKSKRGGYLSEVGLFGMEKTFGIPFKDFDTIANKIHFILNWRGDQEIKAKDFKLCKKKVSRRKGSEPEWPPISYFAIEPIAAIEVENEGEFTEVKFIAEGKTRTVMLDPDCWASADKFKRKMPSKEFTFTGTSADVQLLRRYLSTFKMPHKKGMRTAGIHNGVFVTEHGALSSQGRSAEFEFMGDVPTHCALIEVKGQVKGDLSQLKKFNVPEVVYPVLGWTVACFFKSLVMKSFGQFPFLGLFGEAGSGKTSTLESILMRLWAIRDLPKSIGAQTEFSLMKLVMSSNAIPLCLEENKSSKQDQRQQAVISNFIRSAYNALEGCRGLSNQSLQTYRYHAPVVIAGETGFDEPALLDRIIAVAMSKRDSAPHKAAFDDAQRLPLECIGRAVLERALRCKAGDVQKMVDTELSKVNSNLSDRPRFNAAACRMGVNVLADVTGIDMAGAGNHIDAAILAGISEDGGQRLSAVDKVLEAMGRMSEHAGGKGGVSSHHAYPVHLESMVHYQTGSELIRLHLAGAFPLFIAWARQYGFEGDLIGESTLRNRSAKSPISSRLVRLGLEGSPEMQSP